MLVKKLVALSEDLGGGGEDFFPKGLSTFLFNEDLSNEPNFGQIHLAGHRKKGGNRQAGINQHYGSPASNLISIKPPPPRPVPGSFLD